MPSFCLAEELADREALTGNWFGLRNKLADRGFEFEFVYLSDLGANATGGVSRGFSSAHNFDLILSMDGEKLVNWKGASLVVHGQGDYGKGFSGKQGDAQVASNIEAPTSWRIYQAYLEQVFGDDFFSVLFGIYDLNSSDFDVIETGLLFVNSSHGMGVDLSQSGQNGPSTFPATSLGLRLLMKPYKGLYTQLGIFDGVPDDPNVPGVNRIKLSKSDGLLITSEVGYKFKKEDHQKGKVALGNWFYTSKLDHLSDVDSLGNPLKNFSWGVYAFGEYQLFEESEGRDEGLSAFLRLGYASAAVNQFAYYVGTGLVYTGLIPNRSEDSLGLAVATAINGSPYKTAQQSAGTPAEVAEVNIELTYKAQIFPWLAVQPDMQWIINPGTDPTLNNALYVGSRLEVVF